MENVLIFALVISPIILGLTELVKKTVKFPSTYVPAVAVLVGLLVGFLGTTFGADIPLDQRLWAGVLAGLSATGLFELATKSDGMTKK